MPIEQKSLSKTFLNSAARPSMDFWKASSFWRAALAQLMMCFNIESHVLVEDLSGLFVSICDNAWLRIEQLTALIDRFTKLQK